MMTSATSLKIFVIEPSFSVNVVIKKYGVYQNDFCLNRNSDHNC